MISFSGYFLVAGGITAGVFGLAFIAEKSIWIDRFMAKHQKISDFFGCEDNEPVPLHKKSPAGTAAGQKNFMQNIFTTSLSHKRNSRKEQI